jgi:hypothetical protein
MSGADDAFTFDPQPLLEAAKLPAPDTRPPTGQVDPGLSAFGALGVIASEAPVAAAAFRTTLDEAPSVQAYRLDEAYRPVVQALAERTGKSKSAWLQPWYDRLALPFTDPSTLDRDEIWRDIERQREIDPKAFAELGKREDFEKSLLRRGTGRSADEELLGRSAGLPATLASFAGALPASFARSENLALLPISGGASTIARKILAEGALNSIATALQIPDTERTRAAMGEGYGGEQQLADVASAAAFGAAVRGTIEGVHLLADPGGDKAAARAFAEMVPEHVRTPEEAAALHVLAREDQVAAASPFEHTYQGLDQHAAKLSEAMSEIEDGRIPVERGESATAPSPLPAAVSRASGSPAANSGQLDGTIVTLLERGGLTAEQARGVAAGIHAESGSRPGAVNPASGALGLGQWLGPRKAALIERYGPNPSLEQQVEFVLHELHGGDAGGAKVLAQGDAASVLRSYIQDFMRPAAGHETEGDLARGMAALGRPGETAPGTRAGESGADAESTAALAAEQSDVELARVRADAEANSGESAHVLQGGQEAAGALPLLDRKLFDSDASWQQAQADFVARETGREAATPAGDATPERPAFVAQPPLRAPMADNYLTDLGQHTDRLWRETSLENSELFLPTGNASNDVHTRGELFFADTPDLALGQGDNRGVLMEFDANGLQGKVSMAKPTAKLAWESGAGSEFVARNNHAGLYKPRLRAIRVNDNVMASPAIHERMRRAFARLEKQGWVKTKGDGFVQYERPPSLKSAPARPLTDAQQDRAAEYGLFGDPVPTPPEQAKAFDSDAGPGIAAAAESDWHDVRAARAAFDRDPERALADIPDDQFAIAAKELGMRWKPGAARPIDRFGDHPRADVVKAFDKATQPTFDLDDGKGPRTAAEIDAEIRADKAGLEAIRQCLK